MDRRQVGTYIHIHTPRCPHYNCTTSLYQQSVAFVTAIPPSRHVSPLAEGQHFRTPVTSVHTRMNGSQFCHGRSVALRFRLMHSVYTFFFSFSSLICTRVAADTPIFDAAGAPFVVAQIAVQHVRRGARPDGLYPGTGVLHCER